MSSLSAAAPTAVTGIVHAVTSALSRSLASARESRIRRLALGSLLEMDAHRLDDLGISLHDVREALGR